MPSFAYLLVGNRHSCKVVHELIDHAASDIYRIVFRRLFKHRTDLRNAVEAMNAATSWSKTTGHLRAQVLYYLGENLSARSEEFAQRINDMTGKRGGAVEVEASIDRLFTWAAWADVY